MNLLIVGGGGREHALAWKLAQSPKVEHIYVAPGNAGTAWSAATGRVAASNLAIAADDIAALVVFAQTHKIGLTVVGPEVPLAMGIVDTFEGHGLPVFGPSQAAARLEASKAFAKAFLQTNRIPTARYAVFDDYGEAESYATRFDGPLVIKADGLAAGKGVIVCDNLDQARKALRFLMLENGLGQAVGQVILEERLSGPEVSLLAFCDGETIVPMPAARDHKRVGDGDQGPNTGGMGAYCPLPDFGPDLLELVQRTVLEPTVKAMANAGTPYKGVLYTGLMLTAHGPKVLEFNCRFGDPETQAILPLLETDLLEILQACTIGDLAKLPIKWRTGGSATVVMAAPGYPGAYPKGSPITGLDTLANETGVMVFQAGTTTQSGQTVTAGGRVLAVSGWDDSLNTALQKAYAGVERIKFEGAHYRRDIGKLQKVENL